MATKKISDLTLISAMADDVNLPGENTSQTYRVTGAQLKAYIQAQIVDYMKASDDLQNLGIAASVSGNALTIALKQKDGSSDPSSSAPVKIGFRGTTAGTGSHDLISATAATSLVVSSGSTLGCASAITAVLYVYAINNGGTIELGVSKTLFDEGSLQTSVAEGGAGAADSGIVLYSTTARSSKAVRLIGRLVVTEATAGTWASAPSEVSPVPFVRALAPTVQRFTSGSGNYTVPTPAPSFLRVRAIGGGGGGTGSGTGAGTVPTDGADSTFGSSLITAGKGIKGVFDSVGGLGGSCTVNAPAILILGQNGGQGGGSTRVGSSTGVRASTGVGGAGFFGSGGSGGSAGGTGVGQAAIANTGAGGGGAEAGGASGASSGTGGGAGGYVEALIPNPVAGATYAYSVGAKGNAGGAGTSGLAGGDGASGLIVVEEHYQ